MASTIKNQVISKVYPGADEATAGIWDAERLQIQSRSHEKYLPLIYLLDLVVEINSVVKLLATATSPDGVRKLCLKRRKIRILITLCLYAPEK